MKSSRIQRIVAFAGMTFGLVDVSTAASDPCMLQLAFPTESAWVFSGAWDRDEPGTGAPRLLLPDPAQGTLNRYTVIAEGPTRTVRGEEVTPPDLKEGFKPAYLHATEGGFFLSGARGEIAALGQDLSVSYRLNVKASHPTGGWSFGSLVQWTPISHDQIAAFGDLSQPSEDWESGVVLIDMPLPSQVEAGSRFQISKQFELNDANRMYYYLGNPSLASLGPDRTYFLAMGPQPTIDLLERGQLAHAVADGPANTAQLPDEVDSAAIPSLYGSLERATMPVGIYAWESALYVTVRTPLPEGRTQWRLEKYSVTADGLLRSEGGVILPTTTRHITVIPGSRYWALLEKTEIRSIGNATMPTIRLVNAEAIRTASWGPGFTPLCDMVQPNVPLTNEQ